MADGRAPAVSFLDTLDPDGVRGAVRDLAACLMLPAMWVGRTPAEIATGLLDAVLGVLRADVAYIALHDGDRRIEEHRSRVPLGPEIIATLRAAAGGNARGSERGGDGGGPAFRTARARIGLEPAGVIAAGCARADFPTTLERFVLDAAANQAAIALQTARLVERQRTARDEAERAGRDARFLAEASALLTLSLDVDTILARVARLAVPDLADLCSVDILERPGGIRRVAIAHADPTREDLARRLRERYPFQEHGTEAVPRVIRSGVSELIPDVDDALLDARSGDVEQRELFRRLDVRSAMIVPLVARGRTLGAITLVAGTGSRRYTRADLALAEDLGRRAALAVDNARLYRDSERARAEAETANRAKDEFLATLSHELRTPLTAVLGWARILRTGAVDDRTRAHAMEVVERNAEAQTQLIEDLLDMARITTGKLRLDVRPVPLIDVVQSAVETLRPAAQAKAIEVHAVLDPRAGPVSGDPGRLQQVVWNLMSNAIKFTPRKGQVQVRLQRVNSHVEIVVSDTGQGIGPGLLPYVFDRFRQADSSITRPHGGLGIGLALVKHLAELHGGTVQAESPGENQGATFRVTLPLLVHPDPLDVVRAHPTAPTGAPLPPLPARALSGVRAIIVDDDRDALGLFGTVLTQQGAEVRTAESAAEALVLLDTWTADVLVSDIEMAGEDGYTLMRRVRRRPAESGGAIPAVAVTAYGRVEDRIRALAAGFQLHVPKPVEPRELIAVVASLVTPIGSPQPLPAPAVSPET